jgi:hypothetical protein
MLLTFAETVVLGHAKPITDTSSDQVLAIVNEIYQKLEEAEYRRASNPGLGNADIETTKHNFQHLISKMNGEWAGNSADNATSGLAEPLSQTEMELKDLRETVEKLDEELGMERQRSDDLISQLVQLKQDLSENFGT